MVEKKRPLKGQQVLPDMVEEIGYESIDLLSPEHEKFVYHYATYGNGRAAYQYAYPTASEATARVEASRLLTYPNIIKRLSEVRKEMSAREADKMAAVMRYHHSVMSMDHNELLDANGKLRDLRDLPLDVASVLDVEVQLVKGVPTTVLKVPERKGSAAELARILGMYRDKLSLTHDIGSMSDDQIREELDRLAREVLVEQQTTGIAP